MTDYPRYDITKPTVDPYGMTDVELKATVDNLEADLKDADGMAYQLTEDIKKRRILLIIYRSFWGVRESARVRRPKYVRQWYRMVLYQKAIPFLDVGIHSLGIFGELQVLPDPPRNYMENFWADVSEWLFTPGPYRRPHYRRVYD